MPECDGFRKGFIKSQCACHRFPDLRNLKGMGKPCHHVVVRGKYEHLRLVLFPPERVGMEYPVPVMGEHRAVIIGSFFLMENPARAVRTPAGIPRQRPFLPLLKQF